MAPDDETTVRFLVFKVLREVADHGPNMELIILSDRGVPRDVNVGTHDGSWADLDRALDNRVRPCPSLAGPFGEIKL